MIIKKVQEALQLYTPRDKRDGTIHDINMIRTHYKQRSTFSESTQNPLSMMQDKKRHNVRRESREFTLGSLEKNCNILSRRLQPMPKHKKRTKFNQYCTKHPSRPATHFILGNFNHAIVYCEKCSIELASHGKVMKKLKTTKAQTDYFNQQLDIFMNNLNAILNTLISCNDKSLRIIKKCQTDSGQQIQQINEYFSVLQLTLQMEKNKQYTHVLNMRRQVELYQHRLSSIYENCIGQINTILDNIVMMRENISNDYNDIITEFSPKLQLYKDIVRSGSTKFAMSSMRFNSIEHVKEMFRDIISPKILLDEQTRVVASKFIISKLNEDESELKTARIAYRWINRELHQDINLITEQEEELDQKTTVGNYDILKHLIE